MIAKHRMGRIYCCPKKVMKLYLKREGKKDWDETDERDNKSFLELEKVKYLELYPHNKGIFEVEGMDYRFQINCFFRLGAIISRRWRYFLRS